MASGDASPATLADMAPGRSAQILSIAGQGEERARLLEMGLTAGARVDVLGRAPMGDPIEVRVRGYRLSLRLVDAARVRVEALP